MKRVPPSKTSLACIVSISSTVVVLTFLDFHDYECQAQKEVKTTMSGFLSKTFFKNKREINSDENGDKAAKSSSDWEALHRMEKQKPHKKTFKIIQPVEIHAVAGEFMRWLLSVWVRKTTHSIPYA